MTHSPDLKTTGPFSKSYEDAKSVDFSAAIIMEMYNIIIPLTIENDIWSFLYPFEDEVWICFLLSVPIFIIAMGLAEYITNEEHSVPWATLIGFVLRNVLSENTGKLPDKRLYQKIMVYAWAADLLSPHGTSLYIAHFSYSSLVLHSTILVLLSIFGQFALSFSSFE